jgi:glucose-6-phosphate 1-epimerase
MITEALHSYLQVGDVSQVVIRGLTGAGYFDKVADGRKIESRDPLQLSGETDNVYLNSRTAVTVQDPVLNRKIVIEKSGSSSTVMWNPFGEKAKTMTDLGAEDWKNFLCIEATNALENAVTLARGASHTIRETIKVMR